MISKPLFIMVAESMVMRLPIFQLGWARACAVVTLESWARGVLRKGPPEAVRTTRRTSGKRAVASEEEESSGAEAPFLLVAWMSELKPACAGRLRPPKEAAEAGKMPALPICKRLPARRHWWTGLCSESTGSSSLPDLAAAAVTNSPAATRTSLLERATVRPSFTAP